MTKLTTHCVALRPDGGLAGLIVAGQVLDGQQWQAFLEAAQVRCRRVEQMDALARGTIGREEVAAAEEGEAAMVTHMLGVSGIGASVLECAAFRLADGGAASIDQAGLVTELADALEVAHQALNDASGVVDPGEGEAISYGAELGLVLKALALARPGHWTVERDQFQRDLQTQRQKAEAAPAPIEVGGRYSYQCAGTDLAKENGRVGTVARATTEPDGEHDADVLPMYVLEMDSGETIEAFPDELTPSKA